MSLHDASLCPEHAAVASLHDATGIVAAGDEREWWCAGRGVGLGLPRDVTGSPEGHPVINIADSSDEDAEPISRQVLARDWQLMCAH